MISTYLNTETLLSPFTHFFSFRQFLKLSQVQDEHLLGFPSPPKKGKSLKHLFHSLFIWQNYIPFSFQHTQVLNKSDIHPSSSPNHLLTIHLFTKETPHPSDYPTSTMEGLCGYGQLKAIRGLQRLRVERLHRLGGEAFADAREIHHGEQVPSTETRNGWKKGVKVQSPGW